MKTNNRKANKGNQVNIVAGKYAGKCGKVENIEETHDHGTLYTVRLTCTLAVACISTEIEKVN